MTRIRQFCGALPLLALLAACPAASASLPASDIPPESNVVNVELRADGALSGLVVNIQGVPISAAEVVLWRPGRDPHRTETDALGSFTFTGIAPGPYRLAAGHRAQALRVYASRDAPEPTHPAAVLIVPDQIVWGAAAVGPLVRSPRTEVAEKPERAARSIRRLRGEHR